MHILITIVSLICIWYYVLIYAYTWLGMNIFTLLVLAVGFLVNVSMFSTFVILYYLTPSYIVDMWFEYLTKMIRNIHTGFFEKLEGNIRKTFQIKVLHPLPEKSIRIWNPHGISAVSVGIHNGFRITDEKLTPSKIVTHTMVKYVPIFSDLLRQIHCIFSDFEEIKKTLQNESITIVIGGVDEMRRLKHKVIELVIKRRKGIFKLALETGTPIVPVLTYGEVELFPETDDKFLAYLNKYLFDKFRISLPFPSYESLKNWANLAIRPLDPIFTYTGKPIYVKKIENPTQKHITALRNVYIKQVRELFTETNPGDFTLKIV
jgi:Diacylglycerol acyltransferase